MLYEKVDGLLMTDARIMMSRLLVQKGEVDEALRLLMALSGSSRQ